MRAARENATSSSISVNPASAAGSPVRLGSFMDRDLSGQPVDQHVIRGLIALEQNSTAGGTAVGIEADGANGRTHRRVTHRVESDANAGGQAMDAILHPVGAALGVDSESIRVVGYDRMQS